MRSGCPVLSALIILLTSAHVAFAGSTTVNFDDISVVGPFAYAPPDTYLGQGIVFESPIPVENVQVAEPWWLPTFQSEGGSGTNALSLTSAFGTPIFVDARFVIPGTFTPGVTDHVTVDAFDGNVGTMLGRFDVFDVQGDLIASFSIPTPLSNHGVYTLAHNGIARIRFYNDGDGVLYDNLTFNTPVAIPVPGAVVLGAAGVGFVGWLRRRRTL